MALTSFIDGTTRILSTWLNKVDVLLVTVFGEATTAAEARTALKLGPTISVLDYGAVGDGTTDDAAAISSALTAAAAGGRQVYFPAGTYAIKSTLTVPLNMTQGKIYGDGLYSQIKAITPFTGTSMLTGDSSLSLLTISDMQFDCNNVASVGAINLSRASSSIQHMLSRVRVINAASSTTMINLDGCEDSVLDTVSLNAYSGTTGVKAVSWLVPAGNFHIENSTWFVPAYFASQTGMISASTIGAVVADTGSVAALQLIDVYCYADTGSTKANLWCTSTNTFGSVEVIGGWFNPNSQNSVTCFAGKYIYGLTFRGGFIDMGAQTGYTLVGSGTTTSTNAIIRVHGQPCQSGATYGTPGSGVTLITEDFRPVTTINTSGYEYLPSGLLRQWGFATVTGAANTVLSTTATFPIAFQTTTNIVKVWANQFANGASQMTMSGVGGSTTQATLSLVSSVTVTVAQPILYEAIGY